MANITAALVKELREKTGAGMMDCKAALKESDANLDDAVDWLRAKGLSKAAKKADRVAAEGLVGVAAAGTKGTMVEINAETDFVARNDQFQNFVKEAATIALGDVADIDALGAAAYPDAGHSLDEELKRLIATIGENMSRRRLVSFEVSEGVVANYIHAGIADGLGKIGVLVALESAGDQAKLNELGRQIAMHIAATSPLSLSVDDLDPAAVERERQVLIEQAKESGKPQEIAEKMVEGRLRKYYEEVVLLSQTFVIDGETKVEQVVKNAESEVGAPVKLTGFARFELGEGIEKEEADFAAEVAAATGA